MSAKATKGSNYKCYSCKNEYYVDRASDKFCFYCGKPIKFTDANNVNGTPIKKIDSELKRLNDELTITNKNLKKNLNEKDNEIAQLQAEIRSLCAELDNLRLERNLYINEIEKLRQESEHRSTISTETQENEVEAPMDEDSISIFNNYINGVQAGLPPSFSPININIGKSKGTILILDDSSHIPFYLYENALTNELELYPNKMIQSKAGREYYSGIFIFEGNGGKKLNLVEPCKVSDKKCGYLELLKAGKIALATV